MINNNLMNEGFSIFSFLKDELMHQASKRKVWQGMPATFYTFESFLNKNRLFIKLISGY